MIAIIIILLIAAVIAFTLTKNKKQTMTKEAPAPQQKKSDEEVLADVKNLMLLMEVKKQAEARGDNETAQKVLNMTYDGPLPQKNADGTFTSIYTPAPSFNIAGINFREQIAEFVGTFSGYLNPEPTNKYDPNAIAIYHEDGHHLGYINSGETDYVRSLCASFPAPCTGQIAQEHNEEEDRDYFVGIIYIK